MNCLNKLKERGLKLTPQRRLIVDMIHDGGAHLAAEDIITGVRRKMPEVNKTTIYRTLGVLEEIGCVLKGTSADRFVYHPTEEGHHHHLVCRKCGTSFDCDENTFAEVERSLAEKYGFLASFKHAFVKGLCRSCQNNLN
jgi:Fur family ferric uptake transcriptional regulator